MLLIGYGPTVTEIATKIREENTKRHFIWFSDLDFYRLHADYFAVLPITEGKMQTAIAHLIY